MERFKFRIWDIKQQKYRQRTHHKADTCLNCLSGKVLYGEGIEIYGEEDDKDVVLEQSTGLKDKNGKLIYEGDIFKAEVINSFDEDENLYKIIYGQVSWFNIEGCFAFARYQPSDLFEIEIIGNIHENADLLGEE